MKKFLKWLGFGFLTLTISLVGINYYIKKVNFNFETISDGKVYKSGLIAPEKIGGYISKYKIKTVVDLLDPGVQDALNPAQQSEIDAEANAINQYNKLKDLNVEHINIPSGQVPTKKTLTQFYKIIDDKSKYPLLIHCYHGMGRAPMYSAIYRIEKEGWSNKKAQMHTRRFEVLVDSKIHHSSFAKGREKGDFLLNYKPRSMGAEATVNHIK